MSHLILIRHGQSLWNLENRFTGWVDVELSKKGEEEAIKAGNLIKDLDITIDSISTDEGLAAPYGLAEIALIVNYRIEG